MAGAGGLETREEAVKVVLSGWYGAGLGMWPQKWGQEELGGPRAFGGV